MILKKSPLQTLIELPTFVERTNILLSLSTMGEIREDQIEYYLHNWDELESIKKRLQDKMEEDNNDTEKT